MTHLKRIIFYILNLCILFNFPVFSVVQTSNVSTPSIVVTIKPIYGLVAAITDGVLTPTLLCDKRGSSTHTLSLAPSDIRTLSEASLVIWVGSSYETMMAKALLKAIPTDQLVTLEEAPGLRLYPQRTGGLFSVGCSHCCEHTHANDKKTKSHTHDHSHEHMSIDGHFWLDIENAKHCARFIEKTLSTKYPAHKDTFTANLVKLEGALNAFKLELLATLAPLRSQIALIDHDSLYYMENQFGFTIKGVLSEEPDMPPSPKHLQKLKDELDANSDEKLIKVFFFNGEGSKMAHPLLQKLATEYQIPLAPLNYEGDNLSLSIDTYETCLRHVAMQLLNGFKCVQNSSVQQSMP